MNNNINLNSPGYVYVKVSNQSGYVARFKVTYILRGRIVREQSRNISLGQDDKLFIPEEAISIVLEVDQNLIIGWRPFHFEKFKSPINKCYELDGTAFNPSCNEVNCVN